MAINHTQKGFALLVAVIFASVVLALGLSLASLAYKQSILSSNALQSGTAFYTADSAMECALYFDQQLNTFAYANGSSGASPIPIGCGDATQQIINDNPYDADGVMNTSCYNASGCANEWVLSGQFDYDNGTHCAQISVYKQQTDASTTPNYDFSLGYSASCATVDADTNPQFAVRGLKVQY